MPYQHPLVVRYDDEGRADGLKETNYLVVSSISASDWIGLPVAGGGLAVSDAGIGQIYFREDAGTASGITLPDPNTSGYLNVSTNDAGDPVYSWGPGGAAGIPPYSVNATGEPDAESVWTFNGLNAEFITPTELNTALGSYAQTTALAAFVEIDDAGATNEIYYKSGDDAADGIIAPTTPGTYLSWTAGGFAWQTPAGASPPVQSTTEASLWYFSGISGIAVSAVSAASGDFVAKAVFTGPRQVIYSTGANTPAVTTGGGANEILAVNSGGTDIDFIPLTELTTFTATLANYVEIVDAPNNAVYYRKGDGSVSGVSAQTPDTYLKWDGTQFSFASVATATPYTQDPTDPETAGVWTRSESGLDKYYFTLEDKGAYAIPYVGSNGSSTSVLVKPASNSTNHFLVGNTDGGGATTYSWEIASNYLTTATAETTYVNVAGDTMTGRLFLDKGVSSASTCMFDDVVYFRDETEGLSSIDMHFKVNDLKSYSPYSLVEGLSPNAWKSYIEFAGNQPDFAGYTVSTANSNLQIGLSLLDHWVYKHINGYVNGNSVGAYTENPIYSDNTISHWSLSALRSKTVNLLSATDASALKDINYPTTPTNGQVLTWSTAVNAWVNENATGGVTTLSNLDDVVITGNPDGHYLKYDPATDKWINFDLIGQIYSNDAVINTGAAFQFNVNTSATSGLDIDEGLLYYDDNTKTLLLRSANQTDLRLGQEVSLRVVNKTGTTLNIGTVVYVSGTFATMPAIALASASAEATTHKGMGVLKETLNDGDRGLMMLFGSLTGVDTSLFNVGDILYLGELPGNLTNLYAAAPSHPELIGSVIEVGSSGTILVHVQHGYEINELHNVSRTPASATGQVLVWNNTGGYYAPGSHNDLAGLTTGNPHTQYATLSGCNFTGTVSATTVSATTYQNIPKQVRPISINIENPSANMIIPLFYGEGYIDTINQINSVIIGGTSATWSIYETADVADSSNVLNPVLYENEVTDSTTAGNSHPTNVTFSENWIVLVIKSVSGAISRLHLTVFVS